MCLTFQIFIRLIILLGYMGCGKSLIGDALAKHLDIEFIDLDNYVEKSEKQSIKTIFKDRGELKFRKLEHNYLLDIIQNKDNVVVALGGGTPCYFNTMDQFKKQPKIKTIYLRSELNILVDRLWKERLHRPMVAHLKTKKSLAEFIGKHLFERNFYYEQAETKVDTDLKSVDKIVTEVCYLLG